MGNKTAKQLADEAEKAAREADRLAGKFKNDKIMEAIRLAEEAAKKALQEEQE
jgi:hypothetical protein